MLKNILVGCFFLAPALAAASGPRVVDSRYEVTGPVEHMNRTVGFLQGEVSGGNRVVMCTAVAVGPRHIMTAAHCLYDSEGKRLENIFFYPGTRGRNHMPYGRFPVLEYYRPSRFDPRFQGRLSPRGYDIAIAYVGLSLFEGVDLGRRVGAYGLWGSDRLISERMTTIGYANDRPRRSLHRSDDCPVEVFSPLLLKTSCYSESGQSGSPILFARGDENSHSLGGILSSTDEIHGYITRITRERHQILNAIRDGSYESRASEFSENWSWFSVKYEPRVQVFVRNRCSNYVLVAYSTYDEGDARRGVATGFFQVHPGEIVPIMATQMNAYHLHVHDTGGLTRIGARHERQFSVRGQNARFDRFEVDSWGDRYHDVSCR